MGFLSAASKFLGLTLVDRPPETLLSTAAEDAIDKILHAREHPRSGAWRIPSVREALGVPAILRAVSLISSTTGMLSVQGFRNGAPMDESPRLISRPDPDETPGAFYSGAAANMAKYGEIVWWIAARDGDGLAQALVNVPLNELRVQDNPDNRRRARYTWGSEESTRYSAANPKGDFVHVKYPIGEPYALRGEGPLQLARVAMSIAVESQVWAANFYGGGGHPSDIIKHAGQLDPTLRDDFGELDPTTGLSEADRLKAQYIARDSNTPLVIDQAIESITSGSIDQGGAQMLDARNANNGDAARIYGMPGKLLEYSTPGSSLTYQNLTEVFTEFVKTCLAPLYLEPIEQALSDLLTRSTVARFNVRGFLRADIKTRWEVYQIAAAVLGAEEAADIARREEGIAPGDVEYAPVPFAPPQAIPTQIPRVASLSRDVRCPSCNKLVAKTLGPGSEVACSRCKTLVFGGPEMSPEPVRNELHVHMPENMVRVESPVTIQPPDIRVDAPSVNIAPPNVTVHTPEVTVNPPAITVNPPAVTVQSPNVTVQPAQVTVNPPLVVVQPTVADEAPRAGAITRDKDGHVTGWNAA